MKSTKIGLLAATAASLVVVCGTAGAGIYNGGGIAGASKATGIYNGGGIAGNNHARGIYNGGGIAGNNRVRGIYNGGGISAAAGFPWSK
jgi:hypothetical protein